MLILFGMPVVLMFLFGFAISTDVKNVRTVVVTANSDHSTRQVVERLAQSEYFVITHTVATPREAEWLIRSQKADMAVVYSSLSMALTRIWRSNGQPMPSRPFHHLIPHVQIC